MSFAAGKHKNGREAAQAEEASDKSPVTPGNADRDAERPELARAKAFLAAR
jgi:hypothetical protein